MRLDSPAFAIKLDMDQALKVLKSRMQKKHWHNFKAGTIKLVYVPYYVFNYTVYQKASAEQGGIVTGEKTGRKAANAVNADFTDIVAYIMDTQPIQTEKETSHTYDIEVTPPTVTKDEIKKVAPARLAAQFQTPTESVLISGLSMIYMPVWRIWTTVNAGTFRLDIDTILGTIMNEEQVPSRERGFEEITMETLNDLKTPKNWSKYAKTSAEFLAGQAYGMAGMAAGATKGGPMSLLKGKNPIFLLLILIALLLIWIFITSSVGAPATPPVGPPGAETLIP
ncbi:MAG: hypothetical protein GOV15_00610 [Candidatus Diapherotrites archaeon]|nr:hypothetical protein [Candidatus Diapherotrites archaeon]